MSFGTPLVLLALVTIPLIGLVYGTEQRRRMRAAEAFVTARMRPSPVPNHPGRRRHVPFAVLLLALVALCLAAAKPEHRVEVPVTGGAVMLADDVSASMAATDVAPSRLQAAARAAATFTRSVPKSTRVGLEKFNATTTLLQNPTTDHSLVIQALSELEGGGHTAIGTAVSTALKVLTSLRTESGKRVPSAIVVISDGTSDTGVAPETAAAEAKKAKVPVYTVAVGTATGTIKVPVGKGKTENKPVPLNPSELKAIAQASGGKEFTASGAGHLSEVYAHLATLLGHKRVNKQITTLFAGAGLVLLLIGGGLSLAWFGRFP